MDLAAKDGRPAPARGWIVAMQARQDGIWGRVEWTKSGRDLLEDRAYSGISPVIGHLATPGKDIVAIRRASLVNRPNLRGLNSLNQETDTMFQENIAKLLGLKADASEGDITTALNARLDTGEDALQSQLGEIGTALGCEADASAEAILTAAQSVSAGKDETITALQASVKDLSATVTSLQSDSKNLWPNSLSMAQSAKAASV
ncbi:phage protease [Pseudophaeobacter leonis]|uniref:phage protease n=1 Tax=Pseudophaeobacter leonis TaxID=1144477 RepID=UPI001F4D40F9|nr:phage protease [Pseudophaeobacter leonis]